MSCTLLRRGWSATAFLLLIASPLPVAAQSSCTCGFQDGQFTLSTMSIDGASDAGGQLTGWGSILSDIDNNVCDAPSVSSPTELGGADGIADAPQNIGRDLTWFAYTWDNTYIYFFTERLGSSNNVQRFLYYADEDNDATMDNGENVIEVEWSGSTRLVKVYRHTYNAVTAGGDSLMDSAGVADGYNMPGNLTRIDPGNAPLYSGNFGSSGGLNYEFRIGWGDLGLAGPTAIAFHVAALNANITSNSPPNSLEDNLAGCGGGVGSTQFAGATLVPDRSLSGRHATVQCAAHTLGNTGNGDDIFNFSNSALPAQVSALAWYLDADASGTLNAGDTLLTDSAADSDAIVDSGTLAAGASSAILACYTIGDDGNTYSPSGAGTVTLSATSVFQPLVIATVTDTITVVLVPDPIVTKASVASWDPINGAINPKRVPGSFVTYSIVVTNASGGTIDADALVITDPVPASLDAFVGDLGAPGSGPVIHASGSPACGLSYTFGSLSSAADDLAFSNDGGASFGYTPIPDINGVDAAVTHLRIMPKGVFAGRSAAGQPACTWSFRARVE